MPVRTTQRPLPQETVARKAPRPLARQRGRGQNAGDQEEQAHTDQGAGDHADTQRDVADAGQVLVEPGEVPVARRAERDRRVHDDHAGDHEDLEVVEVLNARSGAPIGGDLGMHEW